MCVTGKESSHSSFQLCTFLDPFIKGMRKRVLDKGAFFYSSRPRTHSRFDVRQNVFLGEKAQHGAVSSTAAVNV